MVSIRHWGWILGLFSCAAQFRAVILAGGGALGFFSFFRKENILRERGEKFGEQSREKERRGESS